MKFHEVLEMSIGEEVALPMNDREFNVLINRQRAELGVFSELLAAAYLSRAGYSVSRPLNGTQARYDLIADDGERLLRIQVKTVSSSNQVSIGFSKTVVEWETGARKIVDVPKYAPGDFDALIAVERDSKEAYFIPASDINLSKSSLYLSPAKKEKYLIKV
jgi:hypothetical protein